jgi:hypothetical protein
MGPEGEEEAQPANEPEAPTSFEGFPQTGCGLMIGDVFKWNKGLPMMLRGFCDAGFNVVHMRLDHMVLIDRPLFICILDTSKKQFNMTGKDSPMSPSDGGTNGREAEIPRQASKGSKDSGNKTGTDGVKVEVEEDEFDVNEMKVKETEDLVKKYVDENRFDITVMPLMPQASGGAGSRSLHDQMGHPGKVTAINKTKIPSTRIAMDMRKTFGDLARSDRQLSKSRISGNLGRPGATGSKD